MSLHVTVLKIEVHGVKSWCVQSLLEIREVGGEGKRGNKSTNDEKQSKITQSCSRT